MSTGLGACHTGSVGDSYDNALAETINDLYKTEIIHKRAPWKIVDWVDWFNNRRLLEPIGNILPAECKKCIMIKLKS